MGQRKGRRKERSRHDRGRSSSSDSSSNNGSSHISERSGGTRPRVDDRRLPRRRTSSEDPRSHRSRSSSSSSSSSTSGSRSDAGERQSRKRKKREVVIVVESMAAYEKRGKRKKEKDKTSGKPCRKDENDRDRRDRKKRHKKDEKKKTKKRQRREAKTKGPPELSRAAHDAKSIHHPVRTRDKGDGGGNGSSNSDSDNHSSNDRASKKTRSRGRSPENPRETRVVATQYETETAAVRAQDPVRVSAGVRAAEGDRDDGNVSSTARRMARAKAMVPMRPEEYAAQQNTIREVFDEDTGRWRLVRGTGEIIERIVSRQEQQAIQQHASRWGWDHKTLSSGGSSSKGSGASGW